MKAIQKERGIRGFTLIELLVVIAIISILAAILFPVFESAREKARQTTCASNERQILLGMSSYAQDYDEFYPTASSETGALSWEQETITYIGTGKGEHGGWYMNPEVFLCPDDQVPPEYLPGQATSYALPDNRSGGKYMAAWKNGSPIQYGGMAGWYAATPTGYTYNAYDAAHVPAPSSTLMLVEEPAPNNEYGWAGAQYSTFPFNNVAAHQSPQIVGGSPCGTPIAAQDIAEPSGPVHSGGWNYGFVDCHVKWMHPEQTDVGAICYYGNPVPNGMWTVNQPNGS